MIPPFSGKMTRQIGLRHDGLPMVLDIVADQDGTSATLEFRTVGRTPKRWAIGLGQVFDQLVVAPKAPQGEPGDPGYIGEFTPMTRADIEHELALDDSVSVEDARVIRRWLYGRQAYWAAKGES